MLQHKYETRKRTTILRNENQKNEINEKFSPDLFSSQNSHTPTQSSQNTEKELLEKQVTDFTWVQCDSKICQKWRRLPVSEAEGLDIQEWYCHMNTDILHNSCEIQEEDYAAYDKLARRFGWKYVMSHLVEGALVWAKMIGYCRWPALVTRDPLCGLSFERDLDGDPYYYHVEYLGSRHTHGWIKSDRLEIYGHKENDVSSKSTEELPLKKRGRCRTKHRALTLAKIFKAKPARKKYHRMPVDEAIAEADDLLTLSEDERLAKITYKIKEIQQSSTNNQKDLELIKTPQNGSNVQNDRLKSETEFSTKKVKGKRKTCKLCGSHTKPSAKNKHLAQDGKVPDTDDNLQQQIANVSKCVKSVRPAVPCQDVDRFKCENLNFKSTLTDKSKEEKFRIDVEMYKVNEKAFDHDLRRFMDRHKLPIRKTPLWQHVPIGLFQFFLAVYERGGYEKVCRTRGWVSVYKELTETSNVSGGNVAKNYYKRNIYPYELYVKGKDYNPAVDELRNKIRKSKKNVAVDQPKPKAVIIEKDDSLSDSGSEDLEAMLDALEEYSSVCQLDDDDLNFLPEQKCIDVKFHDESGGHELSPHVRLADTASEFGHQHLPDKEAQLVPILSTVSFSSEDYSQGEQFLHELQVLDNEFDALEQEMAEFL